VVLHAWSHLCVSNCQFSRRIQGEATLRGARHLPYARQRAPNLRRSDRLLCGFWSLFLSPARIRKVAISLEGYTPLTFVDKHAVAPADPSHVRWVSHCRGLVQLPVAA